MKRVTYFNPSDRRRRRFGGMIVELLVAMILLGTIVSTLMPLLMWVQAERRSSGLRQFAQQEVANTMEAISLAAWDDLTTEALSQRTLRAEANQVLKQARLEIAVKPEAEPVPARQVTVTLSWQNAAGDSVAPVRLTEWFYQTGGRP